MSNGKVAITFLPANHRKLAKERYVNMRDDYFDRMPALMSYEDEYNYERNQKKREQQSFEEKFWINWHEQHKPQREEKPVKTALTPAFEPFIGPENQIHIWKDEDGYTVYSTKSQMQQKIEASREEARKRRNRKEEERTIRKNRS